MKYQLNKLSIALLIAFSAISCGGGGGSDSSGSGGTVTPPTDPVIDTPTVTEEEIAVIEEQLIESGFGNFDDFTPEEIESGLGDFDDISQTEVEIIEEALAPSYDEEQIEEIFEEIGIVEPVVEVTEDTTATFETNVIGLWELDNTNGASGTLLSIGTKTITIFTPNVTDACYELSLTNIYADVDNDITIQDLLTGELSVITVFNEGELTYEGSTFVESDIDTFASAPLCDATTSTQSVQVDINLQDLETQLKLTTGSDLVTNYRWQIFFDVNSSGIYDSGDMNFLLSYSSASDTPNSDGYVNIDDSAPRLFFAYQNDGSAINFLTNKSDASDTSLVVGKLDDLGTVSVNDSTITLTFDTSINPMMAYITGTTPIKVINFISHDADDTDLYGDLTLDDDGPWNWTSDEHKDEYPETDELAASSFADSSNGLVHTDPSDDLVSGEATWVDIESVTVTVTTP